MRYVALLFAVLLFTLAACKHPPDVVETICPDGNKCFVVNCWSDYTTYTDCKVALGKICPQGYTILEGNSSYYNMIECRLMKEK